MSVRQSDVKTPIDLGPMFRHQMESSTGSIPADPAITPDYYKKDGLECYDAQKASVGLVKFQGYLECCIYKYLWRWEDKNGKQDLKKAAEYLAKLIETVD